MAFPWAAVAQVGGSLISGIMGRNEARHQERLQREFAQNAIQWKVADAQKAGIHPLYALGAPTMNYSPVSIGGAEAMGDMGQDIGRALGAGMSKEGQLTAFDRAVQALELKNYGLRNELLSAQIARMRQEMLMKPGLPALTMPGGARFKTGASSTAQKVQDEYGDIVENVYGLARLGYDAYTNLLKPTRRAVVTKRPAPRNAMEEYNSKIGSGGRR